MDRGKTNNNDQVDADSHFVLDIVHRFGVPNSIIIDNGTLFTGNKFLKFCDDYHIRVDWAAVVHPHTSG